MSGFKYGVPLLFRTPVWATLPSDKAVAVFLKPLTYSVISATSEAHYIQSNNPEYFKYITYRDLLADAVIDTQEAHGFPDIKTMISQLPRADVDYLYERLMEISDTTSKQLDALDRMLTVQFHPQYRGDSWNCKTCQASKLDANRGCGFLEESKRDPAPYLPRINGERPTMCPISTMDHYVAQQAAMAYKLMESGLLPESGGLGAQTAWFVRAALLYKRKVNEAEVASMEASRS